MSVVLVVDDDEGVRAMAGMVLGLSGNEVCDAADGLEALEVLTRRPVDLMVLDLQMPKMDGWETCREARREGYDGPIIVLSAYGDRNTARELGADAFIAKPFDPDDLEAKAQELLSNRQPADDLTAEEGGRAARRRPPS